MLWRRYGRVGALLFPFTASSICSSLKVVVDTNGRCYVAENARSRKSLEPRLSLQKCYRGVRCGAGSWYFSLGRNQHGLANFSRAFGDLTTPHLNAGVSIPESLKRGRPERKFLIACRTVVSVLFISLNSPSFFFSQ